MGRELEQGRAALSGQKVIEPDLLTVRGREHHRPDRGALVFEKRRKAPERLGDFGLRHHIGIEAEIDDTAIERHELPIRERRLTALLIGSSPIPDAGDAEARQVHRDGRIGLPARLR